MRSKLAQPIALSQNVYLKKKKKTEQKANRLIMNLSFQKQTRIKKNSRKIKTLDSPPKKKFIHMR